MLSLLVISFALGLGSCVWADDTLQDHTQNPVIYDGLAPSNFTADDLNDSSSPYLAVVKGDQSASHYFQFLGNSSNLFQTSLWGEVPDQPIGVTIDNSSVFTPGFGPAQLGFRRSELIAQQNQTGNRTTFDTQLETGKTAFHFSVQADLSQPLNFTHEYQLVFVELADGTHAFDLQIGTPFNTTLSDNSDPNTLRIRSHNGSVLFQTHFNSAWHNFAVIVDWDNLTLQVYYSPNGCTLQDVTNVEDNSSAPKGSIGDFQFGVLKLPLINPADSPANQADVAHHGIQEGTTEALRYSGTFIETVENGVSLGGGKGIFCID